MTRLLDQFGRPIESPRSAALGGLAVRTRAVRARYDAAQTTDDNSRHWAAVDALSADMANSYAVRKRLRERARYETTNNTTLGGIVDSYVDDVVGQAGPRLQLLTDDAELNDEVEREWRRWSIRSRFGRKLRTLHRSRVVDGEGFAMFITNPRIKHPVRLDLRLLECDRFHSMGLLSDSNNIDGVILDELGNAVGYEVLNAHPGGMEYSGRMTPQRFDADWILHWFHPWRAEQHRGVPTILAALPLAAYDRRFRLAVIAAAETCADISALLYTDSPAAGESANIDEYSAMEIERNVLMAAPAGWKLGQITPQQPASTYKEFKRENTTDMARPVNMPRNIAAGDSSDYNFASGRLDHSSYFKRVGIVQYDMGAEIADPTLERWMPEARLEFGWPQDVLDADHEWLWQQRDPIDPREANAETERLASGATTLPAIYAARGVDYRVEMLKGAEALGVSLEEYQELIRQKLFGGKAAPGAAPGQNADEQLSRMARAIAEIQHGDT